MNAQPVDRDCPHGSPANEECRTCSDGCNGCEDCTDYDEDCESIENKVNCWLYDPARGMCPYLRPAQIQRK